jgi:hypothetical protein
LPRSAATTPTAMLTGIRISGIRYAFTEPLSGYERKHP